MKTLIFILHFFLVDIINNLYGQDIEARNSFYIANKIEDYMSDVYERGLFNGCVLVTKNNEIIYENAFGYSDILNRIPLNTESKFDIGSLTKSFTAMAIMILEEEKKISYSDTLTAFFPDFPSYANKITIHHLLCHQSGILDYANDLAMLNEDLNPEKVLNKLKNEKLNFVPGSGTWYSNSGYFILGQIIEKVSGVSYADFINSRIFQPLGMKNSIVQDKKDMVIQNKAIGLNLIIPIDNHSIIIGDGGVNTTIGDLYKWHLEIDKPTLITKKSRDRAITPHLLTSGRQTSEGYGWHINYKNNSKIVEHGGASPAGYISYFLHPMSSEYTITLLTNFFVSDNFEEVLKGLTSIMEGSVPTKTKSPAIYKLNKYIIDNGVESLESIYVELNADTLEFMPLDELEFIRLSSFYINNKQFDEAIAILNIFAKEYPESIIPLEELITIYRVSGNKKLKSVSEKRLNSLKTNLSNKKKIEIELLNPKTEDYAFYLVVREGPGMKFHKISSIEPGESFIVIGKSMDSEWLKLKGKGWIYNRKGTISKDLHKSLPFLRCN